MNKSATKYFAVIGNPIEHSQSPFIHNMFAQQTQKNISYEKILAANNGFKDVVSEFFRLGGSGLNVTVPFKLKAYDMCDSNVSVRAKIAGAANTLWMQNGQLHCCNTDGEGLVQDLIRLGHNPKNKKILLLGAGGAARGAAPSLLSAGCSTLHITNRTVERAQKLCKQISQQLPHFANLVSYASLSEQGCKGVLYDTPWDIIINATSSSLQNSKPLDIKFDFSSNALAYDMVYGNQATCFMQDLQKQGIHQVADGLGMLVGQAAISFEIWNGVRPEIQPVLSALRHKISASS